MVTPNLRFTLTRYPLEGGAESVVENVDPVGHETTVIVLERDPTSHDLREFFEIDVPFIGIAYEFIKVTETQDGPDSNLKIVFEFILDELTGWEHLFTGILDIKALQDFTNDGGLYYKLKVPIIQNDFWTKFKKRLDTPINIQKPTDEDGNAVTVLTPKTLSLRSQQIRHEFAGTFAGGAAQFFTLDATNGPLFGVPVFPVVTKDEIARRIPAVPGTLYLTLPDPVYVELLAGSYHFQRKFYVTAGGAEPDAGINFRMYRNLTPTGFDDEYVFTRTDFGTYSTFELDETVVINKNDSIHFLISGPDDTFSIDPGLGTSFGIDTALTEVEDTECEAFLAHDFGKAITDRVLGDDYDKFYSPFFGHETYTARAYPSTSLNFRYAQTNGYQIRNRTLAEKPIFKSWRKWFDELDGVFMLGFGTRIVDDVEVIVVDGRETFYDPAVSVVLTNVKRFVRSYGHKLLSNLITVGYNLSGAEEFGAIDDPQSLVNYAPRLQRSGEPLEIKSDLLAGGLAIEATRRKAGEVNKDWRYDNATAIVAINETITADVMEPEFAENFSALANLVGSSKRYNLRLWPVFNLLRHFPRVLIGIYRYLGSTIKFNGGGLNNDAEGTMDEASDELLEASTLISQKQDIPVNTAVKRKEGPLHGDEIIMFEHPLSWEEYKTIRANKTKAVGVTSEPTALSPFDETFDETFGIDNRMFIKRIVYRLFKQHATFEMYKAI